MNLLLDTHPLLWWLEDNPTLSEKARNVIADVGNVVFVSAASAWEIAIKKSLGKLEVPDDLDEVVKANGFEELPIGIPHALAVGALPPHHKDPFDRMLIAQAKIEHLTLVTRDESVKQYGIPFLQA